MASANNGDKPASDPSTTPQVVHDSRLFGAVLLSILSAAGSLLIGWIAFLTAKNGYAPLVIFSLAVGAACGGLVVGLCKLFDLQRILTIFVASLFAAVLAIGTQHAMFYVDYLETARQRTPTIGNGLDEASLGTQKELLKPASAFEFFFRRSWSTIGWWVLDALLTLAGAAGVAYFATGAAATRPKTGAR